MPPPDPLIQSAWQKTEHTLGQLLVLFGASVLIVFVLQIPPSQAAGGDPSPQCVAGSAYCQKEKYKGGGMYYKKDCKEAKEKKDKKKKGLVDKPCKVKKNATTCTGKCTGVGMECKATEGVDTCNGKKVKKADPQAPPKGGEPKKDGGGEKKDSPPPGIPPFQKPEEKKKKEPDPNQNQIPCPADPNLKQGTPECDEATKAKGSTSDSIWRKLMDLAS